MLAFCSYFGVERPIYQLAHTSSSPHPGWGGFASFGTVAASHENSRLALESGAALLVYPGGDYEDFRPSWQRHVVDLGGGRASCGSLGIPGCHRARGRRRRPGDPAVFSAAGNGWPSAEDRQDGLRAKVLQSRWAAVGPQYRRVRSHSAAAKPCREATAVIRNARPLRYALQPGARPRRYTGRSTTWMPVGRTERVVAQTRSRGGGVPESATRLASLHDVDARPIRKGRLGKPVEFGYKAQIVDNTDGVILDHNIEIWEPARCPALAPAIERIIPTC